MNLLSVSTSYYVFSIIIIYIPFHLAEEAFGVVPEGAASVGALEDSAAGLVDLEAG